MKVVLRRESGSKNEINTRQVTRLPGTTHLEPNEVNGLA
jgi:hypothetical protein